MRKQNLRVIQEARLTIPRAENLLKYVRSVLDGELTEFDRLRLNELEGDLKNSTRNLVGMGHNDKRWTKFTNEFCDQCEDYLRLIGKEYIVRDA